MTDTEKRKPQGEKKVGKGCQGCLVVLLIILAAFVVGGYILWQKEVYCGNIVSPCGKYRIDYYYYFRESLMSMMPGSSSDKSGCLYIYRQVDNKKLFREEVPMIQCVGDIRFDRDDSGNKTEIHAPAWLWFEVEEK